MRIGPFEIPWLQLFLVFLPVAIVLEVAHGGDAWIFVTAALAIVPLAGLMGRATEELACRFGPAVGGLLNATFGNAAEIIIALMALRRGLNDVVKASITGSILGNALLVLGLALLAGGLRHKEQSFNRTSAGLGATLLALSAIGLLIPAIFKHFAGEAGSANVQTVSLYIGGILLATYVFSLFFMLHTHRRLIGPEEESSHEPQWSMRRASIVLVAATALIALMAELLVGAVEHTASAWGMTHVFVGVVLVAIVGNAAEHSTAVLVAWRNQMDLSLTIAIGSSLQIALLVAPLLVFVSYLFGEPMGLDFTAFEVISIALAVSVVGLVAHDGRSHWMEGVMLLAVYLMLAVAFFFLPE